MGTVPGMTSPFEDRLTIATPEGVSLELVLVGLGSRCVARLLDSLVQAGLVLGWLLLLAASGGASLVAAAAYVGIFASLFVYDIVFEVLGSGRTPGKRWAGLRVVQDGGDPVGWGASAVRNVVRLVDLLPGMYLVGSLCVLLSSRSQRVGDLIAGTIVVRERRGSGPSLDQVQAGLPVLGPPSDVAGWQVSQVTADDVALVRQFLQRRAGLEAGARRRLGEDLASRLAPRVAGVPGGLSAEAFLEGLLTAKESRR
jgi:uncharacterized RDD family membrane protein YckC